VELAPRLPLGAELHGGGENKRAPGTRHALHEANDGVSGPLTTRSNGSVSSARPTSSCTRTTAKPSFKEQRALLEAPRLLRRVSEEATERHHLVADLGGHGRDRGDARLGDDADGAVAVFEKRELAVVHPNMQVHDVP
jgi:hypothetical protein